MGAFSIQALTNAVQGFLSQESRKDRLENFVRYAVLATGSALLLWLAAPRLTAPFRYNVDPGQLTTCKSNLKNFGLALDMYAADSQGRFPTRLGQLTPNYLRVIPNCPAGGKDTYSATYVSSGGAFTLFCQGHYHQKAGVIKPDYPRYSSRAGLLER